MSISLIIDPVDDPKTTHHSSPEASLTEVVPESNGPRIWLPYTDETLDNE